MGLEGTDEDPVRGEEVLDGGTFGQELGVGQDVEPAAGLGVGLEDGPHGPVQSEKQGGFRDQSMRWIQGESRRETVDSLGGPAGDGRLLDDNLGRGRDLGDPSGSQLDVVQVGGETSTETRLLGRSVDRDEDQVGLGDTLVDLGREEQVPTPASLDDVDETGLVNGEVEVGVVPGVDSGLVDVNDGDLDVRTLEGAVDQELHRMSDMYMKSSICEHSSVFHSHNGTGGTSDVSVSRSKNKHSRDQPIALPKQRLCNLAKTTKYTLSTKTHPAPIQTI